jgi:ABC-type lipoprotein export system ATPase subunit
MNLQRKETINTFRPFKAASINSSSLSIGATTTALMGKEQPLPTTNIVRNLSQETNFKKTLSLTEDQEIILEKCLQGESLFLTGPGGCGKSFLLKRIIHDLTNKFKRSSSISSNNSKLNEQQQEDSVFVLATTGLAAFAIGGMTIHQYLSIPSIDFDEIKPEELQSIIEKVMEYQLIFAFYDF